MSLARGVNRVGSRGYWLAVGAYIALLFATQPFLGLAVDAFKERWGLAALERTAAAVLALGAVVVVGALARVRRSASGIELVLMISGLTLAGIGSRLARSPQESLHFLEYGVLGGLLHAGLCRACGRGDGGSGPGAADREAPQWARPAALALGIGAGLGLLDEVLQIAWPRRYFDWADVLLNVGATVLGLLVAVPAWNAWGRRRGAALRTRSAAPPDGPAPA